MTSADASVLVTGGAGFIGCNLADRLASAGRHVTVFDNFARAGAERNAAWLRERHGHLISVTPGDVRNETEVKAAVARADAVFHFAAQVAVTKSMVDPREDFSVNVEGAFIVLEALRKRGVATPLIFASTNKVYGDLSDVALARGEGGYAPVDATLRASGVSEARSLAFCTPYGCSKGAADQYVLDYAHSFGLPTAVLRMSCIYGPHQNGTEDQGWVAHFVIRALRGEPITIFGDGWQVRDVLYVDDAVDAYLAAWRNIERVKGRAYNLGGGAANAVSLNTLLSFLESHLERRLPLVYENWRPGDQRYYVSDTSRAREELALAAPIAWREGVMRLAAWLQAADNAPAGETRAEAAE